MASIKYRDFLITEVKHRGAECLAIFDPSSQYVDRVYSIGDANYKIDTCISNFENKWFFSIKPEEGEE
jgi:hypothetical protein